MQQKRKGTPLIIIGIILVVIGVGLIIGGNIIDNDNVGHAKSYYNSGHRNNSGTTMTSIGIGVIIVGIILAIIGIVMYAVSGSRSGANGQSLASPTMKFSGRFANLKRTYWVELAKDGTCVWSQQGMQYKGFYRYSGENEWTIYIDGYGEAFRFSIRGEDIMVQGGPVNEVFFCEVRR